MIFAVLATWAYAAGGEELSDQSVPAPLPGLVQTFDYLPSRDGLGLLTGGPTDAGYAADAVAHPLLPTGTGGSRRFWQPRNPIWGTDPRGGTDVYSGSYQWNVDPEYPGYAGYSPFAIVDGDLRIRAQTTSSLPTSAAAAVLPVNPLTKTPYGYVSGVLSSKNSFSQQLGYWEFTARSTNGKATWPALFLLPANKRNPPEIDVLEQVGGYDPASVYRATAIDIATGPHQQSLHYDGDLSQDFHKYAVDWTDTAITFYFDGEPVGEPVAVADHPEYQTPFYMLMVPQIGSTIREWVPAPDEATPSPADMLISRVRVFQRPGPIGVDVSASSYLDDLAVDGRIATISAPSFGESTGETFTKVSDPDGLFTIDGDSLRLARSVPALGAEGHAVRIKVEDSMGRSRERLFTIVTVAAARAQANYLAVQDLTNPFWKQSNLTTPSESGVFEAIDGGQHVISNASTITRAAGAERYDASVEATAVSGRPDVELQVSDATGASHCLAAFDIRRGTIDYSACGGQFSDVVPYLIALPGGPVRVGFSFKTDDASSGFQEQISIGAGMDAAKYQGVTAAGMRLGNPWLYRAEAPAGSL